MKMLFDTQIPANHSIGKVFFYPAESHFDSNFKTGDFLNAIFSRRQMAKKQPLSLYIHFPQSNEGNLTPLFFEYLKREINAQSYLFMGMNHLTEVHFIGGCRAHHIRLINDLYLYIQDRFTLEENEVKTAIEIDAADLDLHYINALHECGFNQLTIVIHQPDVFQSLNLAEWLSSIPFQQVNIKIEQALIWLSSEDMLHLIDAIVTIHPKKIIIAHFLNALARNSIASLQEVDVSAKLSLYQRWIDAFALKEYIHLGTGNWVHQTDSLVASQREGRLYWSCYGYATEINDIVSFGLAAISNICGVYSKNAENIDDYYQRIEEQNLPIVKGVRLKTTDLLRRTIIYKLLCEGEFSVSFIELTYPISFYDYFAKEYRQLTMLADLGFVDIEGDTIAVTDKGKLVIYIICQVFDTY